MSLPVSEAADFAGAELPGGWGPGVAKAIGGCSLFVLALVGGRKTETRCGSSASIRAYETWAGA
jgi:hypothetical protein